ncbi:MAG: hypothetical protein R3220_05935 [Balneolaceae bacterium]|nr:hypothetical protein [Balneolaceae bacterium]
MKQHHIFLITTVLFSAVLIASISMIDGLAGSWTFNVEQTMPEYSKGKLVFEEAEDESFTGKIVFETGRTITMSSVDVAADTVTFKAYVDGGLVTTVCTIQENELVGSVRTPDGMLPFSATREE